jgi:hypothetical protein
LVWILPDATSEPVSDGPKGMMLHPRSPSNRGSTPLYEGDKIMISFIFSLGMFSVFMQGLFIFGVLFFLTIHFLGLFVKAWKNPEQYPIISFISLMLIIVSGLGAIWLVATFS